MSLTCLSPVGTRERHERVVVVVLRVRVEGVAIGLQVDDGLPVTHDGTVHVPARCQLHGKLVRATLDVEGLGDTVSGGERDGRGSGGEIDGPEGILELKSTALALQ